MARTDKPRTYLRPSGQETTPTPGAGRNDGRLRQGDPMVPAPAPKKTGRG